ncbi:MAG: phosphate/phosphite/phosphonate ABC transporter substrate-binding protein [Xanthomonadales bacterium]|nr:phosphate/phosphite/phosphonate ABC transporter substrate-binding protein [Xanthomonadales bacterium]
MKKLALLLCLLLPALLAHGQTSQPEPRDTLILGKISDDPRTDLEGMRPLIDWVTGQMGDVGITRGDIMLADNAREMIALLETGQVDWVAETIGMGLFLSSKTGADIVLERWKHGEEAYRSVLFVKKNSPIERLEDLLGNTVAFEHPGSTTGFMIPALEMYRRGLPIVLMRNPSEQPDPETIGYFFSGDEINTSTWVHRGSVQGGALADTDWSRPYQVPSSFQDDFKVIFRSEPLPRAVELVRKDMDPAVRERLLQILTTAHESERGRQLMRRFQRTTRFKPYDPEEWPYASALLPDLIKMLDEVR